MGQPTNKKNFISIPGPRRFSTSGLHYSPVINENERKGRDVPEIAQELDRLKADKTVIEQGIDKLNTPDSLTLEEKEKVVEIAISEDHDPIKTTDDVTSEKLVEFREEMIRDEAILANMSGADYLAPLQPNRDYPSQDADSPPQNGEEVNNTSEASSDGSSTGQGNSNGWDDGNDQGGGD